jgi:hypothetical protein
MSFEIFYGGACLHFPQTVRQSRRKELLAAVLSVAVNADKLKLLNDFPRNSARLRWFSP